MKIAMYYSCPFETGGVEKTMFSRAKILSDAGNDITFVYSNHDAQLSMLEKWATIGNVRYIDEVANDIFDLVIYDAIYNLKRVKARKNNYIQVINNCLADSKERYETGIPFKSMYQYQKKLKSNLKKFMVKIVQ